MCMPFSDIVEYGVITQMLRCTISCGCASSFPLLYIRCCYSSIYNQLLDKNTVESRSNAVIFPHSTHNRKPVARPSDRLWVFCYEFKYEPCSETFPFACFAQYFLIFDRVITRVYCIYQSPCKQYREICNRSPP